MVQAINAGDFWVNDTLKRLFKELRVALLNSLICTLFLLGVTFYVFNAEIKFAYILSFSLFVIMVNATMIGAIVPVIMKRLKIDPAIATGPFVTTTNDVFGLLIYFTLLTIFLA